MKKKERNFLKELLKHMELYSMLCDSLDGRRIGRIDTCIVNWLYSNTKEKDFFRKRGIDRPVGSWGAGRRSTPCPEGTGGWWVGLHLLCSEVT